MDSQHAAPKVFISYRREDTAGHAGRLFDAISSRFGDDHVFMDVDLQPGVDFVSRIEETIGSSAVLLVIMGPRWATVTKAGEGQPRLSDPHDYVRQEVEVALARPDVKVIPVLVGGGQMPGSEQLPESLQRLRRRNALELSDARWRYDVGRLVNSLAEVLGEPQPLPARGARRPHRGRLIAIGAGVVALVVVVLGVTGVFSGSGGGGGGGSGGASATGSSTVAGSVPLITQAEELEAKYRTLFETKDLAGLRKVMQPDVELKQGTSEPQRGVADVIAEYRRQFDSYGNRTLSFQFDEGGSDATEDTAEVHGGYQILLDGAPQKSGQFGLLMSEIGRQASIKKLCFDCPDLQAPSGFIGS